MSDRAPNDARAKIHGRFARAVLMLYVATALLASVLLLTALVTDKVHDEDVIRTQMVLETSVRAHHLGERLAWLVEALERVAESGDLKLEPGGGELDGQLDNPSRAFNAGVALLDPQGIVLSVESA